MAVILNIIITEFLYCTYKYLKTKTKLKKFMINSKVAVYTHYHHQSRSNKNIAMKSTNER